MDRAVARRACGLVMEARHHIRTRLPRRRTLPQDAGRVAARTAISCASPACHVRGRRGGQPTGVTRLAGRVGRADIGRSIARVRRPASARPLGQSACGVCRPHPLHRLVRRAGRWQPPWPQSLPERSSSRTAATSTFQENGHAGPPPPADRPGPARGRDHGRAPGHRQAAAWPGHRSPPGPEQAMRASGKFTLLTPGVLPSRLPG